MRLGCCATIAEAAAVKAAGFDFLEVNIQQSLQGLVSDTEWAPMARQLQASPLPVEAANALVPGSLPVVGPKRDLQVLSRYVAAVAARAARVGIRRLVFGSGAARKRPDEVAPDLAWDHLVEFVSLAGEACAKHDVVLVIEHLNRRETNTINTLAEARRLCEEVNLPAVATLVDSFHYGLENETDEALLDLDGTLQHVHVAEPIGRLQPGAHQAGPDAYDFDTFFSLLQKIGYDQRVSFEGTWKNSLADDGPACVKLLRQTWDRAATQTLG